MATSTSVPLLGCVHHAFPRQPVLILQKFGMTKPMPKNTANVVKFRRPIPFGAATTPLVEGVSYAKAQHPI